MMMMMEERKFVGLNKSKDEEKENLSLQRILWYMGVVQRWATLFVSRATLAIHLAYAGQYQ